VLAKGFPAFIVVITALVILQQYDVTTGIPLVDTQISKLGTFEWSETEKSIPKPDERPGRFSAILSRLKTSSGEADSEPTISLVPAANAAGKLSSKQREGFLVQVGVFSDSANAERLAETLETLNLETQTQRVKGMRAISVGPFDERVAAVEAAQRIEQVTGLSPLVKATSPQWRVSD
jgi:cell division septation protein DedD